MCRCYTVLDIVKITNNIRKKKNLNALPYVYILKGWHDLVNNYQGKRNPYWANNKIGLNFTFTKFKAKKIARKLSNMKYKGRSNSLGYQYWWKAA